METPRLQGDFLRYHLTGSAGRQTETEVQHFNDRGTNGIKDTVVSKCLSALILNIIMYYDTLVVMEV